jgi:hypothetical protein
MALNLPGGAGWPDGSMTMDIAGVMRTLGKTKRGSLLQPLCAAGHFCLPRNFNTCNRYVNHPDHRKISAITAVVVLLAAAVKYWMVKRGVLPEGGMENLLFLVLGVVVYVRLLSGAKSGRGTWLRR